MATHQNHAYIRGSSAEALDWSRIRYFKPTEFPLAQLEFLNKYVIEELDKLRNSFGTPIQVSPVEGAVVRFNEDSTGHPVSWHDSAKKRKLGQAIDVFLPRSDDLSPAEVIMKTFSLTRFRGLGLYFDTFLGSQPHLMLHLDLRHDPFLWYCPNDSVRKYIYSYSSNRFLEELEKQWDDFHWRRKLERPEEKRKNANPAS